MPRRYQSHRAVCHASGSTIVCSGGIHSEAMEAPEHDQPEPERNDDAAHEELRDETQSCIASDSVRTSICMGSLEERNGSACAA